MQLYNKNCNSLQISSSELVDFMINPNNYTELSVRYTFNCCEEKEVTLTQNDLVLGCEGVEFNPEVFNLETFETSILYFKYKLTKTDGSIICDDTSIFIDCGIKCQIFDKGLKEAEEDAVLLHYALTMGSNCPEIEQEVLCEMLKELQDIIDLREEGDCGMC